MTAPKRHVLSCLALALPQFVGFIVCDSALAQTMTPPRDVVDAAASLQGPDFNVAVKATQTQSQAVTRAASQVAAGLQPNYARNLLQSDAFEKAAHRQSLQNPTVVSFVTPDLMTQTKKMLPKFGQFVGGGLKNGRHVTVSPDGEEIITLIHSLTANSAVDQSASLRKLQSLSENGVPEATNFMGIIFEHGLFGARPDMQRALAYYKSASAAHYQPAIYNLALAAAYGRDTTAGETQAINLISKATAMGEESSYRVCGLGAFLSFRRGDQAAAMRFSKNCVSPLANLSKASFTLALTTSERVKMLRDSLATGADDGYAVIERITRTDAPSDKGFTFCKYTLINRYRKTEKYEGLRSDASKCYHQFAKATGNSFNDKLMFDQAMAGITGFVPAEIAELKQVRLSNRFHYAWSVPYLPFPQADVDLFEPLISHAKP